MSIFLVAVFLLFLLAIADLIVGVSNDAVNFLNSAIGSKVASLKTIMIVAALGIVMGVTFSSGMMEVARKGIFHPEKFLMVEMFIICLAVMLTDVILLDLFNTFGLPTSTTVSIVFELLGAAVCLSLIKIHKASGSLANLGEYINTNKALLIIMGILLSVVVAFSAGALIQFIVRAFFTFQFRKRMNKFGAIWGGIALTAITFFILIKGAKGSAVLTKDAQTWIKSHTLIIMGGSFVLWFIVFQILHLLKFNIFKPIILAGTFALALAFAANDLVNFIGVPLAALSSYEVASASANPFSLYMSALQKPAQANILILMGAGAVMVATLWLSSKARSVTKTSVDLSRQDEGTERFGSSTVSRAIVRMSMGFFDFTKKVFPQSIREKIASRFDNSHIKEDSDQPPFDYLRASVNLVVASVLISFATSLKLPLSTTYVTFMVAMGASLADCAWGRDSAVYRITGVLTIIGGWFFTALMAFTISMIFAALMYYLSYPAVIAIVLLAVFCVYRTHKMHRKEDKEEIKEIYNLKKITDAKLAVETSFDNTGKFLKMVSKTITLGSEGLFAENRSSIRKAKKEAKKIQDSANIIIANIFKTLRLLDKLEIAHEHKYGNTIISLQEISESLRDITLRSYHHISNGHSPLIAVQIEELTKVRNIVVDILEEVSNILQTKNFERVDTIKEKLVQLGELAQLFDKNQIERINDRSSKTRLSILFYGILSDSQKIVEKSLELVYIFQKAIHT